MPTEQGVVSKIEAAGAWVRMVRSEACDECSSKGMCHTLGGGKEMEVLTANPIAARVGDRVAVKLASAPFLKATFLIYIFPILLLLAGAAVGEWISRAGSSNSPLLTVLLSVGSFAVGLIVMRVIARRLAQKAEYRPRIVRVLGPDRLDT